MTPAEMNDVKNRLGREAEAVNAWLENCLDDQGKRDGLEIPSGLRAAMRYSLLAGGKRLRPVLCLLSARLFGLDSRIVMPFAGALECIHTYSLIHDDLPAMDNDDLRRGKPTSHKMFGEATAILAGDALLTDAFAFMAGLRLPPERVLAAVVLAAEAAGSVGMVGGQFLDMRYTGGIPTGFRTVSSPDDAPDPDPAPPPGLEELARMHAMKTGALLRLPCEAGAVLAGAGNAAAAALRAYGAHLGAAFQIMDDVLDATGDAAALGKAVGRDAALGKLTYPALLGTEQSLALARERADAAVSALDGLAGTASPDAAAEELLRGLARYVVNRVS